MKNNFLKYNIYSILRKIGGMTSKFLLCSLQCQINPLNAELNPIFLLLALLGAHHILHVSGVKVKKACGQAEVSLKAFVTSRPYVNVTHHRYIRAN
jgi:hypothetical protein